MWKAYCLGSAALAVRQNERGFLRVAAGVVVTIAGEPTSTGLVPVAVDGEPPLAMFATDLAERGELVTDPDAISKGNLRKLGTLQELRLPAHRAPEA